LVVLVAGRDGKTETVILVGLGGIAWAAVPVYSSLAGYNTQDGTCSREKREEKDAERMTVIALG